MCNCKKRNRGESSPRRDNVSRQGRIPATVSQSQSAQGAVALKYMGGVGRATIYGPSGHRYIYGGHENQVIHVTPQDAEYMLKITDRGVPRFERVYDAVEGDPQEQPQSPEEKGLNETPAKQDEDGTNPDPSEGAQEAGDEAAHASPAPEPEEAPTPPQRRGRPKKD